MEKRYYLKIVDEGFHKFHEAITETELRRRLDYILAIAPELFDSHAINILLHGKEEE